MYRCRINHSQGPETNTCSRPLLAISMKEFLTGSEHTGPCAIYHLYILNTLHAHKHILSKSTWHRILVIMNTEARSATSLVPNMFYHIIEYILVHRWLWCDWNRNRKIYMYVYILLSQKQNHLTFFNAAALKSFLSYLDWCTLASSSNSVRMHQEPIFLICFHYIQQYFE